MSSCDYCESEPVLAGDLPLCATCASRLRTDAAFVEKLTAHYAERAGDSVRRMREQVAEMRLLTPQGTRKVG